MKYFYRDIYPFSRKLNNQLHQQYNHKRGRISVSKWNSRKKIVLKTSIIILKGCNDSNLLFPSDEKR